MTLIDGYSTMSTSIYIQHILFIQAYAAWYAIHITDDWLRGISTIEHRLMSCVASSARKCIYTFVCGLITQFCSWEIVGRIGLRYRSPPPHLKHSLYSTGRQWHQNPSYSYYLSPSTIQNFPLLITQPIDNRRCCWYTNRVPTVWNKIHYTHMNNSTYQLHHRHIHHLQSSTNQYSKTSLP